MTTSEKNLLSQIDVHLEIYQHLIVKARNVIDTTLGKSYDGNRLYDSDKRIILETANLIYSKIDIPKELAESRIA